MIALKNRKTDCNVNSLPPVPAVAATAVVSSMGLVCGRDSSWVPRHTETSWRRPTVPSFITFAQAVTFRPTPKIK